MPFTPTHVAAIIPVAIFWPRALPFSALAIGSMIPDWPLFLTFPVDYSTTHSVEGLFTACLPLGLLVYILFQAFMKRPLASLLPDFARDRLWHLATAAPDFSPRALAIAAMAIVLGASTHLFWDSFTHEGRWGASLIPILETHWFRVAGHPVAGYKVLQYGSTLVGLPAILLYYRNWIMRQVSIEPEAGRLLSRKERAIVWMIALAIPGVVTLSIVLKGIGTLYQQLGRSITNSGLILLLSLFGYCLACRFRKVSPFAETEEDFDSTR